MHCPSKSVGLKSVPARPLTFLIGVELLLISLVHLSLNSSAAIADVVKPNFIVISIDDLGYADIEPFGSKLNRTPNLNRMAAEGRKLTSFYAAPVCSPSRASLMTGCYPKRVLSIPHVLFPGNAEGLHPDEITVAEVLKTQGYVTGIIGKWHLGDQPEFLPTRQGFDSFFGLPYSNDMGPPADGVKSNLGRPLPTPRPGNRVQPPLPLMRNETVLQRVLPVDQQLLVERYTQEAVSFLWQHREEPFFLYLPHSAVHFPLYPGSRFQGKSQHGLFGDWVEEVDWSVGQVLDTVRQLGLSENTFVLFTSDNGGQNAHGALNTPLRGGKGSTFEGGVRVPTIAWWPSMIPPDTESDAIVGMMDILPTLAELAGAESPQDRRLDGRSITGILLDKPDAPQAHDKFFYFRGLELQAVRSGPWKLHLKSGELFHLASDISESANVALQNADVVTSILALADQMHHDLGAFEIGPGCRPLGISTTAEPLIAQNGTVRDGFQKPKIYAGQGIMVAEVTETSAFAQVRLTTTDQLVEQDLPGTDGIVRYQLMSADGSSVPGAAQSIQAAADRDYITRAHFTGLKPGTTYTVRTEIGPDASNLQQGPTATFRTQQGTTDNSPVKFVVVTGMNYAKFHGDSRIDRERHRIQNNIDLPRAYSGPDKHLGYPALETIHRLKPHFFVGTGDNVYYDTPDRFPATTVTQMRQKWHEQFVQPRFRTLFAEVPTFWMVDDHDYRYDDCDNSGKKLPLPADGRRLLLEQLPFGPVEDQNTSARTHRTIRVNRDLQIWFCENRLYRSPNSMPDGPEKSIWGAEQKAWLKQTLVESDATFKLLISPTPMVGPDDKRKSDNHTNIGGFRHEQSEFFEWLKKSGVLNQHFAVVCGDRHWQYHAQDPRGIEEFSCGALVDANSRLGRKPGDPASTDPDGLIRQFYTQSKPSGGFLLIEVQPGDQTTPAKLNFVFHDEQGTVLYRHEKPATK